MKKVYIIRHCEAQGQSGEALLTEEGRKQALELANHFSGMKIDRILSSPFERAFQSIKPLAEQLNLTVEMNQQLTERVLSTENLSDWLPKLRATFDDMDLRYAGGESSREAMKRIGEVLQGVWESEAENTIIVTHGNLMSLLLKHINEEFGFGEWKKLSNPDVFLLTNDRDNVAFERVWSRGKQKKGSGSGRG
ncbi:histidine phosphatase family protein [Lentibacillus sediminis]|uniref:histidine phosphatase family protein n=1 Tax=Lentibacillus sediminis TaxID=1940529 RepID=UPI000C1C55AC|nr:histidine phosphatase family protein [Lentibacillus sediminis]